MPSPPNPPLPPSPCVQSLLGSDVCRRPAPPSPPSPRPLLWTHETTSKKERNNLQQSRLYVHCVAGDWMWSCWPRKSRSLSDPPSPSLPPLTRCGAGDWMWSRWSRETKSLSSPLLPPSHPCKGRTGKQGRYPPPAFPLPSPISPVAGGDWM